jgi:hypothetical protein
MAGMSRCGCTVRRRRAGTTQARRHAEVLRHAADQEAGLLAAGLEDPGQHRRGGRLAVSAGDGKHVAPLQHVFGQPLRPAGVGQTGIEDGFHQGKLLGLGA